MSRLRLAMEDEIGGSPAEHQLRLNLLELMEFRKMTQADLAQRLGQTQPWLSKRLSGKAWTEGGSRFQLEDLDALSDVFGLSPSELLQPGHGKWDRRRAGERRIGTERRRSRTRAHDVGQSLT